MAKKSVYMAVLAAVTALCSACGGAVSAEGEAELPAGEKYVALTFDDGPRRATTERLLDGLRERGAKATFFLIGEQIEANADLVTRMAEEGHQIGNHTWSHQRLDGAHPDEAAQEVERTEAFSVPLVKWSVDPRDWESRDAGKVTRAILEHVEPGSIILLHDIYPTSVDAALRVVDQLQAEGYWFVTVEELLWLSGVTPEAGTMYRAGQG